MTVAVMCVARVSSTRIIGILTNIAGVGVWCGTISPAQEIGMILNLISIKIADCIKQYHYHVRSYQRRAWHALE